MTRIDFLYFKAGLLCYGASLSESARKALEHEYPEFFEKGFIDAVNMNVLNSNICVSIAEDFSEKSQFTLEKDNAGYYIMYKGERLDVRFFDKLPNNVEKQNTHC